MNKGFITIATGQRHYYEIAANLLKSYRLFTKDPYPFAIIAEEHNEYTALFDDVIITTEAARSFTDKFLLLKLCPYDETIFFDADSLAYGDLNKYWDFFEGATDFSATGENFDLHSEKGAWYNIEDIGRFGQHIKYKSRVHAGVCFIRKSERTLKMYEDCLDMYKHFDKLYFHTAPASIDECILGVTMPMNDMKAIPEDSYMLAAYPCLTSLKANLYNCELEYATNWHTKNNGILLHWGTIQTKKALYLFNVECLNLRIAKGDEISFFEKIKYKYKARYYYLYTKQIVHDIITFPYRFTKRVIRYINRKLPQNNNN